MRDRQNLTALYWGASAGHPEIIKVLAAAGANPNAIYEDGFTPLIKAANDGNVEVVKALLTVGANPALKTKEGYTAEDYAKKYGAKANPLGYQRIVQLLQKAR